MTWEPDHTTWRSSDGLWTARYEEGDWVLSRVGAVGVTWTFKTRDDAQAAASYLEETYYA